MSLRTAAALAVAISPAAARAQLSDAPPAADLVVDVDGDGKPDHLHVDAPAQLLIERGGGGGQLVPFAATGALTEARLVAGGPPTARVVVATAHIGGAWEAVALGATRPGAALVELWRGPVGPTADDEYEQWVDADAGGLVRYQARADQRRCDGVEIQLFRERWDPKARGFAPTGPAPVAPPTGTPTVAAVATAPGLPAGWYRAVATSQAAGATDAGMLIAPRALGDADVATAWLAPAGSDGVGTVWGFRASVAGGKVAAIRVVPSGDGRVDRARPARLIVFARDGAAVIDVPDPIATRAPRGQAYTAVLPTPLDGCVSIALAAVHRGRGAAVPAAVAELAVLADVELTPEGAGPKLAAMVAAGGLGGESAARLLIAAGAPAVVAVRAALVDAAGEARARLLAVLAQIRDPGVVGPLAAALADDQLPADRVATATATLAALAPDGPAALAALIDGAAPPAVRAAAIDAIASVDRQALLAHAGRGDGEARARLARAVASLPIDALIAAARAASDDGARAALWRAVGLAGAARATERPAAVAALTEALAAAGPSYAIRYRALAALGQLADGAALAAVVAAVTRLPDTPAGHALARVATRALAQNPAAAAALVGLAAARDPGTRLEAVRGLGEAGAGDAAGDPALATVLAGDAWPALRQAAATSLGGRCARPAPAAALIDAVGRDAEEAVRVEAVAAIGHCATPAIDRQLLAWIDDGGLPLAVRDRALAVYGERPGAVAAVLTRFVAWRSQAFSSDDALRLAIRAATTLGLRGAAGAAPELLAAARDTAFPELAAAAMRALGALGPACPAAAVALLRERLGADDQQLALAARAAFAQCRPARP